ncbi:MAG: archaeosortase/exosortase family protein, partial [Phycisphaeraceae bacterium]|nr:archaeosortase/exosortase family protein [Phycisphaeraceae bacterium]
MSLVSPLARNGWSERHLVTMVALCVIGIALMHEAWADILHLAMGSEESYHIFLVPLIFGWLVWVRRERFRYCRPVDTWLGPVLVLAGWGLSTFGYYHAVESFWHGGAVVVLIGCVVAVMGREVLVRFAPAFVVLIFLVPVTGRFRQP